MYKISTLIFSTLMLAALCCSPCLGQEWARQMFTEFEHDFGVVPMGTNPVFKFKIKNKYEETIRIRGVTSSCGCTTASLSKTQLASQEEGELICQFNSNVGLGLKQATVTVQFAEPFVGEVQVAVKGTIRNDVLIEPAQLEFGSFSPGKSPRLTTNLSRFMSPNWRIRDVRSVYSNVGVTLTPSYRGQDKVVYELAAEIKPNADPGRIQADLVVIATDGFTDSQIRIPMSGIVASALTINPETLTFRSVNAGEEAKQRVILKADREFKLIDVTCEDRNFTVRADGKSAKLHFVEVLYTGDQPGTFEADLTFVTDLDSRTTGTMRAIATVVAPDVTKTAGRK